MQTLDPSITISVFPSGPDGNEWTTQILVSDPVRLTQAQYEARLIEQAAETDRRYGTSLESASTLADSNRVLLESVAKLQQRVVEAETTSKDLHERTRKAEQGREALLAAARAAVGELLERAPATRQRIKIANDLRAAIEAIESLKE